MPSKSTKIRSRLSRWFLWTKEHVAVIALLVSTASMCCTALNSWNSARSLKISAANLELTANNTRDQRYLQFIQFRMQDDDSMPRIVISPLYTDGSATFALTNTGKGTAHEVTLYPLKAALRTIVNVDELEKGNSVSGRVDRRELHSGEQYYLIYRSGRGTVCTTNFIVAPAGTLRVQKVESCAHEYDFLIKDQQHRIDRSPNGMLFGTGPPPGAKE